MSDSVSNARTVILERIRARLGNRRPVAGSPEPYRVVSLSPDQRVERFREVLEGVGGHVHHPIDEREVGERVRSILGAAKSRRLLVSDAARLVPIAARLPATITRLAPDAPRAELLAADTGLSCAQWGIAETGTLVLESAREKHRLASLLPPVHLALLPVSALLGTLGEALAALCTSTGAPTARTITFITGPSRTADIELELVVGVHGPRELHVLLLQDR